MSNQVKKKFTQFIKWRYKNISHKTFTHIMSVVVGLLAGLGSVTLKNLTHFLQHLLEGNLIEYYHTAFYFVFPIIGLTLVYLIIRYIIRHKVDHGIPSTLFAISKRKGIMSKHQMFGSILTAPLTVGFGGSVGLEGPSVATGAAISSNISRMFHMNLSTRNLLIGCAAAGALSSIFKAPIAAIVFAIEVFSLDLTLASMLPLLLASLSAIITSYFFLGSDVLLPFKIEDSFIISDIPFFIALGVVAGLISIYFTEVYDRIQKGFDSIDSPVKRLLLGGVAIGILVYFIPPLYGEGFESINNLIKGHPDKVLGDNIFGHHDLSNVWVVIALLGGLVIFKIIASAITFGAGGVGGIFAPTLFMGSIMGNCVAKAINNIGLGFQVSESNFTLVGMAGVMAGVLHAPLTAIFLIAEVTGGYELFIPLMITATISFAIAKYVHPHSVYSMELGRKGELITHDKDHAVLMLMDMDKVIEKNFIPIFPGMSLGDIVQKAVVKSSRNIFPVIDEKEKTLLGVILLDNIRSIMFNPSLYNEVKATDIMQAPPDIIEIEKDKMTTIMEKFENSGAWNLPVIKEGKYLGFVSKSKLLTAYRRELITFTK